MPTNTAQTSWSGNNANPMLGSANPVGSGGGGSFNLQVHPGLLQLSSARSAMGNEEGMGGYSMFRKATMTERSVYYINQLCCLCGYIWLQYILYFFLYIPQKWKIIHSRIWFRNWTHHKQTLSIDLECDPESEHSGLKVWKGKFFKVGQSSLALISRPPELIMIHLSIG